MGLDKLEPALTYDDVSGVPVNNMHRHLAELPEIDQSEVTKLDALLAAYENASRNLTQDSPNDDKRKADEASFVYENYIWVLRDSYCKCIGSTLGLQMRYAMNVALSLVILQLRITFITYRSMNIILPS